MPPGKAGTGRVMLLTMMSGPTRARSASGISVPGVRWTSARRDSSLSADDATSGWMSPAANVTAAGTTTSANATSVNGMAARTAAGSSRATNRRSRRPLAGASLYTSACAAATTSLSRSATASSGKSRRATARSLVAPRYSAPSSSTSSAESRATRPRARSTSMPRRAQRARWSSTNRSMDCTARMRRPYHADVAIRVGRLEVETPDHVVLRYTLAGLGNRGFAAVLDFLVAFFITAGLQIGYVQIGTPCDAPICRVLPLLPFLLGLSYFILLEWLWNGQTIGKRAFGLRVINEDGSPAGFVAAVGSHPRPPVHFLPTLLRPG